MGHVQTVALATLASLALGILVAPSPAAGLEPKKPSQLVTLTASGSCSNGSGLLYGRRVLPNGTDTPFVIPKGQVLVVTRWGFAFQNNTGLAGSVALLDADGAPWWFARVAYTFDADGRGGAVIGLSAVVGEGQTLCARGAGLPAVTPDIGFVEGYLTKAK